MSDADLRRYFEDLTDAEIRESFASGPSAFEPAAWGLIADQVRLRSLQSTSADDEVAHADDPVRAAVVESGDELRKRVEAGGTIALVLAGLALVLGLGLASSQRSGRLLASRVVLITTVYAIAGILMRRTHNTWAALVAALLTTLVCLANAVVLARSYPWATQAVSALFYGPPVYWLWRAFFAARALQRERSPQMP